MSRTTCPVLRPTIAEFANFYDYIRKIEEELSGGDIGICKVIPPEPLIEREYSPENLQMRITCPVKQVITGIPGIYDVTLVEQKPMCLKQFLDFDAKNKCEGELEELERKFWKSLSGVSAWEDPVYGADQVGSLMDGWTTSSWNLNRIDSLLRLLDDSIPGVNCAMLYVGTWRSMFAYHVEDMDLYSINYLHSGKPKSWYSVNYKNKNRFETMAGAYFGSEQNTCKEYLRHKTKLFSPAVLKSYGIGYDTVVQYPGEFIITFPGAYHAGFNHGYNLAEATNFGTWKWLREFGTHSKLCICRPLSVRINVNIIEAAFARDLLRNQCTSYSIDGSMLHDLEFVLARQRCCCIGNKKLLRPFDHISSKYFDCEQCHASCHETCMMLLSFRESGLCDICGVREHTRKLKKSMESTPKKRKMVKEDSPEPVTVSPVLCQKPLKIGDTVSTARLFMDTAVTGVLSNIIDGCGRFHVKGSRKCDDVWIPLNQLQRL